MGKKDDTSILAPAAAEPVAPVATPPKSQPVAPAPVVEIEAPKKAAASKAPAKKKPAKKAARKPAAKKRAGFSTDDIALRAYFISEHRQRHGRHGDSHSDWIEAERQLKAERAAARKKAK
jgi:hypothetical protein